MTCLFFFGASDDTHFPPLPWHSDWGYKSHRLALTSPIPPSVWLSSPKNFEEDIYLRLCTSLADIRDVVDAHKVLEAVRLNILPLIRRRLVAHERAQLRSGNVFVWEEADDIDEGGLVRWTEGRRW